MQDSRAAAQLRLVCSTDAQLLPLVPMSSRTRAACWHEWRRHTCAGRANLLSPSSKCKSTKCSCCASVGASKQESTAKHNIFHPAGEPSQLLHCFTACAVQHCACSRRTHCQAFQPIGATVSEAMQWRSLSDTTHKAKCYAGPNSYPRGGQLAGEGDGAHVRHLHRAAQAGRHRGGRSAPLHPFHLVP